MACSTPFHPSELNDVDSLIADLVGVSRAASARASTLLVDLGEAAVPSLCAALSGSSLVALARVAWVLGRIRSPHAAAPLRRLLGEQFRVERARDFDAPLELLRIELVDRLLRALHRIGPGENARAIGVGLMDRSPQLRRTAGELLAQSGAAGGQQLCRALRHGELEAQLEAAWALGQMNDREVVIALCDGLASPHPGVQLACAQGLFDVANRCPLLELRRALPRLRTLSRGPAWGATFVRDTARQALQQIEAATATMRDVPLPAAAPPPSPASLPRPASGSDPTPLGSPTSDPWPRRLRFWLTGGAR